MKEKVILVLVDGLRPDSIPLCGHSFLPEIARKSLSTMNASTVIPIHHITMSHVTVPQR